MDIQIPALLPHQQPILEHTARHKVLRAGRRYGKDVFDLHALVLGHGTGPCTHRPGECQRLHPRTGEPMDQCWLGLVHGLDVLWIPRDYRQAVSIWDQEIKPRFSADLRVRLNSSEHTVVLPNGARLLLMSPENPRSIAGLGKTIAGAIFNECAWYDLADLWRAIIRPLLADNVGWSIMSSTTNAGWDGNADRLMPSYFNRICLEIKAGTRSSEWHEWYGTGKDNPVIRPAEFQALVEEYPQDSIQLKEEVFAELLQAGAGLAFPNWEPEVHVLPRDWHPTPGLHRIVGGMDWGIRAKSCVALCAVDRDRNYTWWKEWTWTEKDAYQAGWDWGQSLLGLLGDRFEPPEALYYDPAMDQNQGHGKTIKLEFEQGLNDSLAGMAYITMIPAPTHLRSAGKTGRVIKLSVTKRMLQWGPRLPDGTVPAAKHPRMRFTADCEYLVSSFPVLPYDPKQNDRVDEHADDHGYDAVGNVLLAEIEAPSLQSTPLPANRHPGYFADGSIRPRMETQESRMKDAVEAAHQAGRRLGGRYGLRRRVTE